MLNLRLGGFNLLTTNIINYVGYNPKPKGYINNALSQFFLRIILRPSLIGRSTTSTRSSCTIALLKLCIFVAIKE